jgi:hypothetical protein
VRNYLIKFDVDENTVVRCTRFSRQWKSSNLL